MPKGKHNGHLRGSAHHRWNRGQMLDKQGYVLVRVGRSHPLADSNGYVRLHVLVLATAGVTVPSGSVIHHDNEDKQDNQLENLKVVTRAEHIALHGLPGHNRKAP